MPHITRRKALRAVGALGAGIAATSLASATDDQVVKLESRLPVIEKFQGTWKLMYGEYNGGVLPDDTLRTTKLTVAENQYRLSVALGRRNTEELVGEITLNAEKSPNEIDVAFGNGVARGIYMIVDDFLFLVFRKGAERPKTFSSPSGSLHELYLYKREAPLR